ncbi:sigma-70 family RNA polymerase sigma factor [Micromonospora sp. H61]|uniref:sigma-70 family RNA polymerase sigma factor n=1 Tax=Micromonospora sp. H61 TaxID=2824888 RepID=UPI001B368611|nr:sigma-70 family RNA polymerase sigma factor [Micromonospora sp. H61]MBQ0991280.1 sigma-70 family RNA polymerase sigma factor [Micromonospora sp. H61]
MVNGLKSVIPPSLHSNTSLPVLGANALTLEDETLIRRAALAAKPKAQDLEDVEQAVREEFCRRAGSYSAASGVPFHGYMWPYLVGAARHVVRTDRDVRKNKGLGFDIPVEDLTPYDAPAAPEPEIDPLTAQSVRRFVRGLDPTTRYIIFRRYWQDVPVAQIAREIGVRPQSAQRRHDKALAEGRLTGAATATSATHLTAVAA